MLNLDEIFGGHRVMVILRGMPSPGSAVDAAHRAWNAGVELVEVPIGQPGDTETLAAVAAAGQSRDKVVGAGTIIATGRLQEAHAAGARYTVAPGFDSRMMAQSQAMGMPHLPGVATPSEVQQAWSAGCRWVKVFPASTLGPTWFSAIRGPFPDVSYLATGGVSLAAAPDYVAAGASIVAFGASAVAPERVDDLAELVNRLVRETKGAVTTPEAAEHRP
ncbi:bifunctional 4-hydroxy-2-oxoglutarate aldolase/2-dehydro-3-deoxy-phosphogluconate aldolase [Actinoplanes sp. CA-030573]|uniref:bifunctional 4-hydroxy-2-oxoglutarate aldolase/2-dehydro-3-deoxy-phosphogluconate aldolase n=1 Tax=Actinoplanes sp. CA-030573 TaxID=3239898 RepID=UPI003D8EA6C0